MRISIIRSDKWKKAARALLAAAFWLAVWQLLASLVGLEILLPTPWATARKLWELAGGADFWHSVAASCLRILAGFGLALAAGTATAVLCYVSRTADALIAPLFEVIKATPVASFIILALVWLPNSRVPVFCALLMVAPMIWAGVLSGLRGTDPRLLEMGRAYRLPALRKLRFIYLPSVLPQFVTAAATGLGFAWKSGIAAEVLARPRGAIGTGLYDAKLYLETSELFAWTAVVILLSVLIEKLFVRAVRALMRRMRLAMEVEA